MIPDRLRLELVDAIFNVPLAKTEGRNALLAGIPNAAYFQRNMEHAAGDILMLVLQLEENFGPGQEWRLIQLIKNSESQVRGTDLGKELLRIQRELEEEVRPRLSPAEIAQVHLFDLRMPVYMCVGQLRGKVGISGFVVPGATSELLLNFCDSLRHRGDELGLWKRGNVAAVQTPLTIDPKVTTVSLATEKVKKFETQLQTKHVIWPIYVDNPADGDALWGNANEVFGRPLEKHLVVIFGMPDGQSTPKGMQTLPSPMFTSREIKEWIEEIAKSKAWPNDVIERSVALVVTGYSGNGPLPVNIVYTRLERYHRLVNEHRNDQKALLEALVELQLTGD